MGDGGMVGLTHPGYGQQIVNNNSNNNNNIAPAAPIVAAATGMNQTSPPGVVPQIRQGALCAPGGTAEEGAVCAVLPLPQYC